MSEMVERVAAEIERILGGMIDTRDDTENAEIARRMRLAAVAVIGAMREPTREMASAAYDKLDWGYPDGVDADFVRAWREMIDAALKPSSCA